MEENVLCSEHSVRKRIFIESFRLRLIYFTVIPKMLMILTFDGCLLNFKKLSYSAGEKEAGRTI